VIVVIIIVGGRNAQKAMASTTTKTIAALGSAVLTEQLWTGLLTTAPNVRENILLLLEHTIPHTSSAMRVPILAI
jgi:hypothetical protein